MPDDNLGNDNKIVGWISRMRIWPGLLLFLCSSRSRSTAVDTSPLASFDKCHSSTIYKQVWGSNMNTMLQLWGQWHLTYKLDAVTMWARWLNWHSNWWAEYGVWWPLVGKLSVLAIIVWLLRMYFALFATTGKSLFFRTTNGSEDLLCIVLPSLGDLLASVLVMGNVLMTES